MNKPSSLSSQVCVCSVLFHHSPSLPLFIWNEKTADPQIIKRAEMINTNSKKRKGLDQTGTAKTTVRVR